jgi:O-antigen/teichoic acid export membrane protein
MTPASATKRAPPSLRTQAFWLTAARVVSVLIQMAVPIILVRVISKTELGLYRQVLLYVNTAASLAALGVNNSVFYFMPREPERGGQIALNILLYNVFMGSIPLLVLVFYPGVLGDVFRAPALEPYAIYLGALVLLLISGAFLEMLPSALRDVKASTVIIVGVQFTKAVMFTGTALLFPSVRSLLTVGMVHHSVQIAVLLRYMHKTFGRFWSNFDWSFFRRHISYATSLGVFGLLMVVQRDINGYFISASFTPAEFAIYAIGCTQVPMVRILVDSVSTVMAIRVSELQSQGAHKEILRLIARAVNRLAAVQFPIAAALLVMGRDLIILMYTKAYESSADIFVIQSLALLIGVFLVDPVFRAYRELIRYMIIVRIVVVLGLIAGLYFSIQHFGLIGAVLASLAAAMSERAALSWIALRKLKITIQDLSLFADLLKVSAVTVTTGLIAYAIRNLMSPDALVLRLAITGTSFAVMYLTAMFVLKLPGSEELSKERLTGAIAQVRGRLRKRA